MADVSTTYCTRWKITLSDSTVLAYTDHDENITVAAVEYISAVGYVPSAVQTSVELSPDNMDVAGIIDDTGIKEADLLAGRFDYADIEVTVVDYLNLAGGDVFPMVRGKLGRVSIASGEFHVELNSLAAQLQQNIGRIFSPLCDADYGDTRCGETNTATGFTVTAVTDTRNFTASGRAETADYWNGGLVTWTTGAANAGYDMDIKNSATGGVFELYEPMPYTIATGDTGTLQRGCDKTYETCLTTYDNLINFRGFKHVPGLQKLIKGP